VPIQAVANPAPVHFTLYLGFSCHTQNVGLYAVNQVTLNAQGNCDATDSGGPITIQCSGGDGGSADAASDGALMEASSGDASPADAAADVSPAPLATATSTITFDSLYNANPDESDADQRHTVVPFFDIYLADPRDVCPGGLGPPPPCRGHLTGRFDFYFERGRPAQPFP
jgi:hypothetical protein